MIDSILIYRELNSYSEYELLNSSLYLTNKQDKILPNGIIKTKAKIDNLKILYTPSFCKISGSLIKFYTNKYYHTLTRQSIEKAINKLEYMININLDNAFVYIIELSRNIPFNKHNSEYTRLFEKLPYTKIKKNKHYKNGNFESSNNRKSFSIYDKKLKLIKCNEYDSFLDNINNLVKIEVRLKEKVTNQLRVFYKKQMENNIYYSCNHIFKDKLRVKDLYDRNVYNFLCDYWFNTIKNVNTCKRYNKRLYDEFIKICYNSVKDCI